MDLGQVLEQFLANKVYLGVAGTISVGTIVGMAIAFLKSKGVKIGLVTTIGNLITKTNAIIAKVDDFQVQVNDVVGTITGQLDAVGQSVGIFANVLKVITVSLPIEATAKTEIVAMLNKVNIDTAGIKASLDKLTLLVNTKIDLAQNQVPNQLNAIKETIELFEVK